MTKSDEKWQELRREPRRPITGVARMAQRTRVFFDAEKQVAQSCKILDASNSGFRIALKPMPDLVVGAELVLELTGGAQRNVRVCWVSPSEVGLQLLDPPKTP